MLKLFFVTYILAPAIDGSLELGLAKGRNGNMLYSTFCIGIKTDLSMEADVSIGIYKGNLLRRIVNWSGATRYMVQRT